jgi:hypothetical protein
MWFGRPGDVGPHALAHGTPYRMGFHVVMEHYSHSSTGFPWAAEYGGDGTEGGSAHVTPFGNCFSRMRGCGMWRYPFHQEYEVEIRHSYTNMLVLE